MMASLADHLWQSTLFAALAAVLALFCRRNGANVRYGLWFAASVKFLIPCSILFATGRALAPQVSSFHGTHVLLMLIANVGSPLTTAVASHTAVTAHRGGAPLAATLAEIAAALWAGGCFAVLLLWLLRWVRVYRLARSARPLSIPAPIPVKASPTSVEPGIVGVLRPVLVIPEGLAERLSEKELRAVLAHELCHVRRRDNLTAAVHMAVEAIFWFFPVVWWVGARLILERERACDESVLAGGNDPGTYAESILKVCKFYLHSPLACMAGASGGDLKKRVEAIMNPRKLFRLGPLQRGVLALTASAALVVPLALGIFSVQTASAAAGNGTNPSQQTIDARRYEQARPRTTAPYNPTDFDKFVGYYELSPTTFFHITRNGSHYMTQLTGQPALEVYPDSAGEFFSKIVPAQITFEQSADGAVTGLLLHQGGLLHPAKRVDAAVAERAQAALAARIRSDTPSPGTEAAVRHQIAAMVKGEADYSAMTPALATAARQQAGLVSQMFTKLGAFDSLAFKGVSPQGLDVYDATFARGHLDFIIAPLDAGGKIQGLLMRPPLP